MAMLSLEFWSATLDKWTTAKVFVNDKARPPYPSLYMLHGLAGDQNHWTRYTLLERQAREFPFLIVMLDGARSFYCDSVLGPYETFIVKELVPYIDRLLPTRKPRRYRAVGGLSMGGYGAIKLGLKYPDLFGAVAAHSAAVQFAHNRTPEVSGIPEVETILASTDVQSNDVYALAEESAARKRPKLYFDCGREDFLRPENDRFHRHLKKLDFKHVYRRFPGGHTWEYWNEHVGEALCFLLKGMRLKPVPL